MDWHFSMSRLKQVRALLFDSIKYDNCSVASSKVKKYNPNSKTKFRNIRLSDQYFKNILGL